MNEVWIVSYAYGNDPETIDTVFATEAEAKQRAAGWDDDNARIAVYVRRYPIAQLAREVQS